MWKAIPQIMKQLQTDKQVKVVIFRGVGQTAFAAGADISEFESIRSTPQGGRYYNEQVTAAEWAIQHCPMPTIAMIQGFCIGGGCEIAMACDMRFSSTSGIFGITPAKLGTIYNLSGTKNLLDLVGPAKAKDILFSSRLIGAEEAFQIGLIDRIYPEDLIISQTYEYADLLCRRSQLSIHGAKRMIANIQVGINEETPEVAKLIEDSFQSEDYREGVRAFIEKREPKF
jgi:enoyl-CoA hydratase